MNATAERCAIVAAHEDHAIRRAADPALTALDATLDAIAFLAEKVDRLERRLQLFEEGVER